MRSTLRKLLTRPDFPSEAQEAWTAILTPGALCSALQEAVHEELDFSTALNMIHRWERFAAARKTIVPWEKAAFLVWCAHAATQPAPAVPAESPLSPLASEYSHFEQTFVEFFRGIRSRSAEVLVARGDDHDGSLYSLELTLLPGTGIVGPHPSCLFSSEFDQDFADSMNNAWSAARLSGAAKGVETDCFDGLWRVLDEHGRQVTSLVGASAGGAAALGWRRMFESGASMPDDRILVMAATDAQGRFGRVDRLRQKTIAAIRSDRIDTIVVADQFNETEVRNELHDRHVIGKIDVVRTTELEEIVAIRSVLSRELITYLDKLSNVLDETPWLRKITDIAVPIRVVEHDTWGINAANKTDADTENESLAVSSLENDASSSNGSNAQAARRRSGADRSVDNLKPDFSQNQEAETETSGIEPIDPFQRTLYEESDSEAMDEINWETAFCRSDNHLVVLRAGPGHGKTIHTKYRVVDAARTLCEKLRRFEINPAEVSEVPLWLSLVKLSESKEDNVASDIRKTVLGDPLHLTGMYHLPEFLEARIPHSAQLYFDGFDELGEGQANRIKEIFRGMRDWTSRRCITCRYGNYSVKELALNGVEYFVAPFRDSLDNKSKPLGDIRRFIGQWFSEDRQRGEKLVSTLRRSYALHNQCRSPLLLTLTCLEHQERDISEKTTSADLFQNAVDKLLRNSWRTDADLAMIANDAFGHMGATEHVAFAWSVLPRISFDLFSARPTENRFSQTAIIAAMENCPNRPKNGYSAISWLTKRGILVPAGFEGPVSYYSFAHRAILEFLAAKRLAELPNVFELVSDGIRDENAKVSSAWCFVAVQLMGLSGEPSKIVELLSDCIRDDSVSQQRETFWQTLVTCLLECREALAADERNGAFNTLMIGIDIAQFRLGKKQWNEFASIHRLIRVIGAAEKHYGYGSGDDKIREQLALVGRRRGNLNASERAITLHRIQEGVKTQKLNPTQRWGVLLAQLMLKGDSLSNRKPRRLEPLQFVFDGLEDDCPAIRSLSARAIGEFAFPGFGPESKNGSTKEVVDHETERERTRVLNVFLSLLDKDDDDHVKSAVISALGRLKFAEAIQPLVSFATWSDPACRRVRNSAFFALGQYADRSLSEIFWNGLDDDDVDIVSIAISNLATVGDTKLVDRVVAELLTNEFPKIRKQAAWALGRFRRPETIDALIAGTDDEDADVARMCYGAISRFPLNAGNGQVIDLLETSDATRKKRLAHSWKTEVEKYLAETAGKAKQAKKAKSKNNFDEHFRDAGEICFRWMFDEDSKVRETAAWALSSIIKTSLLRGNDEFKAKVATRLAEFLETEPDQVKKLAANFFQNLLHLGFGVDSDQRETLDRAIAEAMKMLTGEVNAEAKLAAVKFLVASLVRDSKGTNLRKNAANSVAKAETKPEQKSQEPEANAFPHSLKAKILIDHIVSSIQSAPIKLLTGLIEATDSLLPLLRRITRGECTKRIGEALLPLFEHHSPEIRMTAVTTFVRIAFSTNSESPAMIERLRKVIGPLLDDKSSDVNGAGLWLLAEVIKFDQRRGAEDSSTLLLDTEVSVQSIVERVREFLSDDPSETVIGCSFKLIARLIKYPVVTRDAGFLNWLIQATLDLDVDYLTLTTQAQILSVLQDLIENRGDAIERNLLYETAQISFTILRDSQTRKNSDDHFAPIVQTSAAIVLQRILAEHLRDDKELIHKVLGQFVSMMESNSEVAVVTAFRACEEIVTMTEVIHPVIAGSIIEKGLKKIDHSAWNVRAAVIGAFAKCVAVVSRQDELTVKLLKVGLASLRDAEDRVRRSALVLIEQLLTKTEVANDEKTRRKVVNELKRVFQREEKLGEAVLITIQKAIYAFRHDDVVLGVIADLCLEYCADDDELVRQALSQIIALIYKLELFADDALEVEYLNRALEIMLSQGESEISERRRDVLSKILGFFRSNDEMADKVIERCIQAIDVKDYSVRRNGFRVLAACAVRGLFNAQTDRNLVARAVSRCTRFMSIKSQPISEAIKLTLERLLVTERHQLVAKLDDEDKLTFRVCAKATEMIGPFAHDFVAENAVAILLALVYLPPGSLRNQITQDVVIRIIRMLNGRATSQFQISACFLLRALFDNSFTVLIKDGKRCASIAKRANALLLSDDVEVQKSAAALLLELAEARPAGFFRRTALIESIARNADEVLNKTSIYSLKQTIRLLLQCVGPVKPN